jgi:hypothetical protein
MKQNYSELIKRVNSSSNPEGRVYKKTFSNESLNESLNIPATEINEYVRVSMRGVHPDYTYLSKEAAKEVIKHLEKSHGKEVDFKFQGSIETNTHIWSENDVDVVQITNKSHNSDHEGLKKAINESHKYTFEENRNLKKHFDNYNLYSGDQMYDLKSLRIKTENVLTKEYDEVSTEKAKAVCVKMQNPKRSVDVVTASNYRPLDYLKSNCDYKQGIQVYDKSSDSKLSVEYPFWSIKLIQEKNIIVQGRLKKLIRFLKNVKFDTGIGIERKLSISSFDINAICYDIETDKYISLHYLQLVKVISDQLEKLINNSDYRNNLRSIDMQEFIFKDKENSKLEDLIILKNSVDLILEGIIYEIKLVG